MSENPNNPDPIAYLADRRVAVGQKRPCGKVMAPTLDWQHEVKGGVESWSVGPFRITPDFGPVMTTYKLHINGVYMQWFAQVTAAMAHAEGLARKCAEALYGS